MFVHEITRARQTSVYRGVILRNLHEILEDLGVKHLNSFSTDMHGHHANHDTPEPSRYGERE